MQFEYYIGCRYYGYSSRRCSYYVHARLLSSTVNPSCREGMKQDGDRVSIHAGPVSSTADSSCRGEMKHDGDKVAAEWVYSVFLDS